MGGLAVYIGILCGLAMACCFTSLLTLVPIIIGTGIMLYLGVLDDTISLTPTTRIICEIAIILTLIYGSNTCIDNLHGLWGIHQFSWNIAVPLTVFAGVGIINAINMIDGVNGLSSGLSFTCYLLFGTTFLYLNNLPNACLAFVVAAALIPFIGHNVFGKTSRMFIGDAGTMMMGVILTWFVIKILSTDIVDGSLVGPYCNLVSTTIAILIVPIADTLRVMALRIYHGRSPFSPDKTHLHHAFIACGFSHIATSLCEILIGIIAFTIGYLSHYYLHLTPTQQLYLVILEGILLVWCPYIILSHCKNNPLVKTISAHTHYYRRGWWIRFQNYLDRPEFYTDDDTPTSLLSKLERKFRN